MRISEVYLRNVKSYEEATIRFPPGTVAISGQNGSGKSTILEAIGFALFDFLPYRNQREFMRHNATEADVRVTFLSRLDECEYQAVRTLKRSTGSADTVTSTYYVYSFDAKARVAQQKQDVQEFLRAHIGLDDYADLGRVFADVLGVPQGRLTADFLLAPTQRKSTFDPLLRVDAFRHVFEKLRDVLEALQGNVAEQERLVAALEPQAARLGAEEAALAEFEEQYAESAAAARALTKTQARLQEERQNLEQRQRSLEQQRDLVRNLNQHQQHLQERLAGEQTQVDATREAMKMVETAAPGHDAYLAAQQALAALEVERQAAEILQRSGHTLDTKLVALQTRQAALAKDVEEAGEARTQRAALEPLVTQQERLELALQEFGSDFQFARQLGEQVSGVLRKVAASGRDGPSGQATVDLPPEPNETAAYVRIQLAKQHERLQAVGLWLEQRAELGWRHAQLQEERAHTALAVAHGESFTEIASQLDGLERQLQAVRDQIGIYAAQRRFNEESQEMAADGLCPFFKDFCPKVEEGKSLAPVIAGLIREYADQAEQTQAEGNRLEKEVTQAKAAQRELDRSLALTPRLQQLDDDIKSIAEQERALGRRIEECLQDVWSAQAIDAALVTLAATGKRLRQEIQDLGNPRQVAERLYGDASELEQRQEMLAAVTSERDAVEAELTAIAQRLSPYADLDPRMTEQRELAEESQEAYQTYLRYQESAADLPRREEDVAALAGTLAKNAQAAAEARQLLEQADAAWNPAAFGQVQADLSKTQSALGAANERVRNLREQITRSRQEVAVLKQKAQEMAAARLALAEAQAVRAATNFLRTVLRDAGPHVARYLIQQISAEANTLFSEIMGDASAELSLTEDYDILLEQHGHRRAFLQLSGGEQMSAALAVRLGLLRQLSDLDIAFFDEPTQNMDSERRHNLAEQLQRVTGFHQLFVISHDDTFEPLVSSVLRVRKENGVSAVAVE